MAFKKNIGNELMPITRVKVHSVVRQQNILKRPLHPERKLPLKGNMIPKDPGTMQKPFPLSPTKKNRKTSMS
jgi:hypothetical protein